MSVAIDLLPAAGTRLGESPLWDHRTDRLWSVDVVGQRILSCDAEGAAGRDWTLDQPVGSIGLAGDGLVAALADGFYRFDPHTGATIAIARPDMASGTRFNDGKADRGGNILAGSMRVGDGTVTGKLWRLGADGALVELERDLAITNAICVSPDGGTLYLADSVDGILRSYRYDGAVLAERNALADCREAGSGPDGATVDAAGNIWVALVMAQAIACYAPDGRLLRTVPVPVPYPSCPAFGGPDLSTLYVTSIADSGHRLVSDHPDRGRIVAIRGLDAVGLPEGVYR